jgi:RNA polymerase sigma factor (sigma-70 family)
MMQRVRGARETGDVLSDEQLLAACARGEQAAWDAVIDRYAALIYSIPLKYGFTEADAADVFQSVCVTLLEKLGSVRDPRRLAAWIITTTSRQCWAIVRQQQRELGRASGALDPGTLRELEPPDPTPLPEEEVLSLERQHLVRLAVGQLPPRCRRLVESLFADPPRPSSGSYREVAAGLGIPVNSLGPTRARCLLQLRRLLEDLGYVYD